jgi:thioredoxin 1
MWDMRLSLRIIRLAVIAGVLLQALTPGCSGDRTEDGSEREAADTTQQIASTRATPSYRSSGVTDGGMLRSRNLPRMIDLGRGQCVPCKMMEPILKELKEEYRGKAIIEIIDLNQRPESARQYDIRMIPTQIFFDTTGAEVWRHEGFLPRDAIVKQLRELGAEPGAE